LMEEDIAQDKITERNVRVASVQFPSKMGDADYNRKGLSKLCEEAAAHGAKIIVMPETSVTGYLSQDIKTNWRLPGKPISSIYEDSLDPSAYAETHDGPSTQFFASLAQRLGTYITVPFLEVDNSLELPQYYNSICLASPEGKIVAHYRKNNPWPLPEQSWATAGTELATYDTEYGKVGLAICFDIHTILSRYAQQNIWALLYPIAWVGSVTDWFRQELPHKLRESRVPFHIIGSNWSVDNDTNEWRGYGFSTIYGPSGAILAGSGLYEGQDIIYADIPTERNMQPCKMDFEYYRKFDINHILVHNYKVLYRISFSTHCVKC